MSISVESDTMYLKLEAWLLCLIVVFNFFLNNFRFQHVCNKETFFAKQNICVNTYERQ